MKLHIKSMIIFAVLFTLIAGCGGNGTPDISGEEIAGYGMVTIPAADFEMGYQYEYDPAIPDNVNRYFGDEQPVHPVTLSAYQIGITEVTQELYERIMGENPSTFTGADLPVTNVGASRALEFCNILSESAGLESAYDPETGKVDFSKNGFRLPTEAEWEYACRAGSSTIFTSGMTAADLGRAGWYEDNSGGKSHPVAQKEPNAFGLYDMHGNVFEFCYDGYSDPPVESSYPAEHVTDPISSEDFNYRLMRGGGWFSEPYSCRSYTRSKFWTGGANYYIGFRLARSVR
ncbi:formylglycine-generating enzyme family protein [Candidatus Latescibacterota bacterium]